MLAEVVVADVAGAAVGEAGVAERATGSPSEQLAPAARPVAAGSVEVVQVKVVAWAQEAVGGWAAAETAGTVATASVAAVEALHSTRTRTQSLDLGCAVS